MARSYKIRPLLGFYFSRWSMKHDQSWLLKNLTVGLVRNLGEQFGQMSGYEM